MKRECAADPLLFLPLGGAGEIGMNLNLYGYGPPNCQRWLMVDLGVSFVGSRIPGLDVIMPDPTFIEQRRDQLEALVITHAHEDHLGAVPYLWSRLRCPVYATGFALAVLKRKLAEVGLEEAVPLNQVTNGERIRIGPFDVELIPVTHSIPEANAVAIRTPAGTVLHSGDWKFDPDPVIGPPVDRGALRRIGDEGVLALVCDSTNVFELGRSGSEGSLLAPLIEQIARCGSRVAVTCFATNVARLRTIAAAAAANGRDVVITGSSLKRNYGAAIECGYLTDILPFLDEGAAGFLPKNRVVIVCTGSQGEANAALGRIASGEHPRINLEAGDTVIFSSRVIPGNEATIGRLQNALLRQGVEVITQRNSHVHVSGHPARDELTEVYQLIRPRIAVPIHGELRHLIEHAKLARSCQVSEAVVAENGTVVRLSPGDAGVETTVPAGRLALEGNRVVPLAGNLVRERARAIYNGMAVVTVVLNSMERLAQEPRLSTVGLVEQGEEFAETRVCESVREAIDGLPEAIYKDDEAVRKAVRIAVRRTFRELSDKRPLTHVHLVRIQE